MATVLIEGKASQTADHSFSGDCSPSKQIKQACRKSSRLSL